MHNGRGWFSCWPWPWRESPMARMHDKRPWTDSCLQAVQLSPQMSALQILSGSHLTEDAGQVDTDQVAARYLPPARCTIEEVG
jgi:hypothetical protein